MQQGVVDQGYYSETHPGRNANAHDTLSVRMCDKEVFFDTFGHG